MSKIYNWKEFSFALWFFVICFLAFGGTSIYGQGLACNAGVNVSLDQDCIAIINATHILKGEPIGVDPSDYKVVITNPDGSMPDTLKVESSANSGGPFIASNEGTYIRFTGIGRYKVSVERISDGLPCWGDILIEDKLPPFTEECFCPEDSPFVPEECVFSCATVTDFLNSDSIAAAAGVSPMFMDHCGNIATVEFDDVLTQDTMCGNWIITRTWRTLVSNHGALEYVNLNCTQKFYFQSFGADAIFAPKKKVIVQCGTDTDPESLRNYFSDTSIFPGANVDSAIACAYPYLLDTINDSLNLIHSIGQGLTPGTHDDLCKLTATYTDTKPVEICGDVSYKFVRSWHIIDWCTNETIEDFHQVIKVLDTIPPGFEIPDMVMSNLSDPWRCDEDLQVPPPDTLYDNCSSLAQITWIAYVLDGVNRIEANTSNGHTLNGLTPGEYVLTYVVTDLCGNESIKQTQLIIKDEVSPVALSKYEIKLTLTSHEEACSGKVFPHSIDANSFDACGSIAKYEIRRKDGGTFGPFVKFSQGDITSVDPWGVAFGIVVVEMRIMDESGNSNLAWTRVRVEDKNARVVNDCGDRRIGLNCEDDIDAAIDTYAPTVLVQACVDSMLNVNGIKRTSNLDSRCNTGTVVVDYFVEGSTDTICSKTFILGDIDSVDIDWPEPIIEVSCAQTDFGDPVINGAKCNLLAPTEDIQEFDVPGSRYCKKLVRTITLIDWCLYQANQGDTIGVYKFQQTIKVTDDDAPIIECADVTLDAGNDCEVQGFQVTASGSDASTCPNELLTWEAAIDSDGNGSYELELTPVVADDGTVMAVVNETFRAGVYGVRWRATDACGNIDVALCTITILDTKAPSPQCISTVSTAVMNTTGTVGIWAIDFDLNSNTTDDCGGQLTYSFSGTDRNVPSKTYSCADIPNGVSFVDTVRVYVWDQAGNVDFCTVMVRVDDNSDVCVNTNSGAAAITGNVVTAFGASLESAEVKVKSMQAGTEDYKMTDQVGEYAFSDNSKLQDYEIVASKNDDYLNGISTIDMVLLQRHILGIKSFEHGYQTYAADVNADEKVTTIDLLEMRKLVLGLSTEFSSKKSWSFVDASHSWDNATHPWPVKEFISVERLEEHYLDADFMGVKLGDINGNAIANSAFTSGGRSYNEEILLVEDRWVEEGETVNVTIDMSHIDDIYGLQLALELKGGLWKSVTTSEMQLDNSNYIMSDVDFKLTWSNGYALDDAGLLSLEFIAQRSDRLSRIVSLVSDQLPAQVYSGYDVTTTDLSLAWKTEVNNWDAGLELYQNIPNPFDNETVINFRISKPGKADLAVFDMTGKLVYGQTASYDAGMNSIILSKDQLGQSGILYYQLTHDNQVATRKMLSIE